MTPRGPRAPHSMQGTILNGLGVVTLRYSATQAKERGPAQGPNPFHAVCNRPLGPLVPEARPKGNTDQSGLRPQWTCHGVPSFAPEISICWMNKSWLILAPPP